MHVGNEIARKLAERRGVLCDSMNCYGLIFKNFLGQCLILFSVEMLVVVVLPDCFSPKAESSD